jgi:hypothetical protein
MSTDAGTVGFAPDLVITQRRKLASGGQFFDRLRGNNLRLDASTVAAEQTWTQVGVQFNSDTAVGVDINGGASTSTWVAWCFKRAPLFMDAICYSGNAAVRAIPHNLGVAPELILVKNRNNSGVGNWIIWHKALGANGFMVFSNPSSASTYVDYFPTLPTATNINVGNGGAFGGVNCAATDYAAYMFATLAGISKVGSYIGNGSSQVINCGFATGARFMLIRRKNADGEWYVFDTSRGIVGNDYRLSLNKGSSEIITTDDSVNSDNSGFSVVQNTITNLNITSEEYIFLAIA